MSTPAKLALASAAVAILAGVAAGLLNGVPWREVAAFCLGIVAFIAGMVAMFATMAAIER